MDARTGIGHVFWLRGESPLRGTSPAVARLLRAMAVTWLALGALCAVVVLLRRCSGALVEPLPFEPLAGAGFVLAVATAVVRRVLVQGAVTFRTERIARLAPSVVLLATVGAVSLGGGSLLGVGALWGIAVLEEVFGLRPLFARRGSAIAATAPASKLAMPPVARGLEQSATLAVDERSRPAVETGDEASAFDLPIDGEPLDAAISQQVVRRQRADGGEAIEGLLRVGFASGQRYATAHVAICPPLAAVGECFAEPGDGPAATVKVAQSLPYGVRFEIKLDEPAESDACVLIEFSILSASPEVK